MRERGSAAIEFALGVLVLLVPVALLVLSFGPTLERRVLARSLAVDVARAVVAADGSPTGVIDRMVWQTASAGVPPGHVRVAVCGGASRELVEMGGCELPRHGAVEVTIEVVVEPQLIPGGPKWVSYTHREAVDAYRSRS
jgi:Flp pilus assembly protein TadG